MKMNRYAACCLITTFFSFALKAQLYKVDIEKKINKSSLIIEGTVTDQYSFWNPQHTLIFTSNTVKVSKLFKGKLVSKQIEVITQGGTVGDRCLVVSDLLQLNKNETGIFFCNENALSLHSLAGKNILYDVYGSQQGFLKYDVANDEAYAPFADYKNISQNLYNTIVNKTGNAAKIVDSSFQLSGGVVSNGTSGTLATISSFSPSTVHGGALTDPTKNQLTISGSGFGSSPSGSAGIKFKDGNNDHATPDYKIDYNSPYIISWTDTKIVVEVPDRAATGKFAVVLNDGSSVTSSSNLQVFFSVLNAEFSFNGSNLIAEPRLVNDNNSGGYSFNFSTSTDGGGIDFSSSPAAATFLRAVTTWKEIVGANLTQGANTTTQSVADDGLNIIMYDNQNTGEPVMADGVLEATYSWFGACKSGQTVTAEKTGFDILIRNPAVSEGSTIDFEDGPCFPATGSWDLETIVLHEIGHALNLAHINDDYQGTNYTNLNPEKVMHYAILDYADRRSLDAAAYQGAIYTIKSNGIAFLSCGYPTQNMIQLSTIVDANDECPSSFPATEIADNTSVTFDLAHTTSNRLTDPAYTQVNCENTGTFVTNNAYYAFMNGTKSDLLLTISNYTLTPSTLSACSGQGVRLALYDVSSCPEGQNYPTPIHCATFNKSGIIPFTGLATGHKYLLYFDGLRNTKASFNVVFNGDSSSVPTGQATTVQVYPNPVGDTKATVLINNTSGTYYQYALFDITGKLITKNKISVSQTVQSFTINMNPYARGVYVLRVTDENGKTIAKKKILK